MDEVRAEAGSGMAPWLRRPQPPSLKRLQDVAATEAARDSHSCGDVCGSACAVVQQRQDPGWKGKQTGQAGMDETQGDEESCSDGVKAPAGAQAQRGRPRQPLPWGSGKGGRRLPSSFAICAAAVPLFGGLRSRRARTPNRRGMAVVEG